MSVDLDTEPTPPADTIEPALPAAPYRPTIAERSIALLEVLLCSDYPTQFALASTMAALGYRPFTADGHLITSYVVTLSLLDSALLIGLILIFLKAHGERARTIFLGSKDIGLEARAGVPLTLAALAIGLGVLASIQAFAPWLHTVESNPFQELLRTPRDAALFAIVVIVAGGIREELQRAFLLHRFRIWLGGGAVGVVVTSVAFGTGHLLQGTDAAIATGLLGAFWGVVYLRRRSVVAPVVSHSGFNLLQIVQYIIAGS